MYEHSCEFACFLTIEFFSVFYKMPMLSVVIDNDMANLLRSITQLRFIVSIAQSWNDLKHSHLLKMIGDEVNLTTPLWLFKKCVFQRNKGTLGFNIIISHIIPKNFVKVLHLISKEMKIFFLNINYFIFFFFGFFDISLLQRN